MHSIQAIKEFCLLGATINLSPMIALYFYEEIGILSCENKIVRLSNIGKNIKNNFDSCNYIIAQRIISYLIDGRYIDMTKVKYDINKNQLFLYHNAINYIAAIFRNYLITIKVFEIENEKLVINSQYRDIFEQSIVENRKKITEEQLLINLEKQRADGLLAEEYVVQFETKRLGISAQKPKRISDIDVAAGYDVLSYESGNSDSKKRLIEVKAFHDKPHFYWSANEKDTAEKYGEIYYIYLVDLNELQRDQENYKPIIIKNPIETLKGEEWLVEPSAYKIVLI